jgi:hypothetical protein
VLLHQLAVHLPALVVILLHLLVMLQLVLVLPPPVQVVILQHLLVLLQLLEVLPLVLVHTLLLLLVAHLILLVVLRQMLVVLLILGVLHLLHQTQTNSFIYNVLQTPSCLELGDIDRDGIVLHYPGVTPLLSKRLISYGSN